MILFDLEFTEQPYHCKHKNNKRYYYAGLHYKNLTDQ